MSGESSKHRVDIARASRLGFTLIELLVVIAIIAILISILLPSMSAARAEGGKAKCLANLRSFGQASIAYAQDDVITALLAAPPYSAIDPSDFDGFYDWGGMTGKDDISLTNAPLWGYGPNSNRTAPVRPMNTYMYGPGQINKFTEIDSHKCPGDFGWVEAPFYGAGSWATEWKTRPFWVSTGTSYRANACRASGGGITYSMSPYMRPLTRIESAGETMLYMESIAWEARWNTEAQQGAANAATLPGWHRKTAIYNVTFCDGHSATVKIDRNGMLPTPPDAVDPNYAQLWTRGEGPEKWRMDIRREPLIRTN